MSEPRDGHTYESDEEQYGDLPMAGVPAVDDGVYIPFKQMSTSFEVTKSTLDSVLGEVYKAHVAELVQKQSDAMVAMLGMWSDGDYVQTKVTRWARLRARLRNLRYDIRHALCCGVCKYEDW